MSMTNFRVLGGIALRLVVWAVAWVIREESIAQ